MFWYGEHMGAGGWVLVTLFTLLFWGGLIVAGIAVYRAVGRNGDDTARRVRELLCRITARSTPFPTAN